MAGAEGHSIPFGDVTISPIIGLFAYDQFNDKTPGHVQIRGELQTLFLCFTQVSIP